MPIEHYVVALIGMLSSIVVAWLTGRATANKAKADALSVADKARTDAATAADALYASLCKDLMGRINQLVAQLQANLTRIETLEQQGRSDRMRIAALEADNARLTDALAAAQSEIDKWKSEADSLRATLKSMQKRPAAAR